MLPRCQRAQVHRRKAAYSHGTDGVEEGIDITDRIFAVGGIQHGGCKQRYESEEEQVHAKKVEILSHAPPKIGCKPTPAVSHTARWWNLVRKAVEGYGS